MVEGLEEADLYQKSTPTLSDYVAVRELEEKYILRIGGKYSACSFPGVFFAARRRLYT